MVRSIGGNKNVFLLPYHEPSLKEFIILAKGMKEDNRYRPILILIKKDMEKHINREEVNDIDILRLYGSKWYVGNSESTSGQKDPETRASYKFSKSIRRLFQEGTRSLWWNILFDFVKIMNSLNKSRRLAMFVFEKLKPIALLVAEDRHFGEELAFIKVAENQGVVSAVIPFAYYSGPEDLMISRKDNGVHNLSFVTPSILRRCIKKYFPNQIYESPFGTLLFYTVSITLALSIMNMLPNNPWHHPGDLTDFLGVVGEDDREKFIREGISGNRIVITGQPSLDMLYKCLGRKNSVIEKLRTRFSLDAKKNTIICAVPQLADHHILDWAKHREEVRFLCSCLHQTGANILLSLHPKSDPKKYGFVEKEFSFSLLDESLAETLVAADLFVATYSSTVRWAVLLNIPVVIIDFYGLNYTFYDHLKGAVKITEKRLLTDALKRILEDKDFYQELIEAQRQAAVNVAMFDGKCSKRICDMIETHVKG